MPDSKTPQDIYDKVIRDQGTHHIFSGGDQEQLAEIIKQLGLEGENTSTQSVTPELQEQILQDNDRLSNTTNAPAISATDEEIEELFQRLSTFDLEKISEQQSLYNIYLDKLRKYKKLPNFHKIMKQQKYYTMVIDHLDYISTKIVAEQKQMEEGHNITMGI